MNLKKALTPKDTEEIRPGLFVKKTNKGYRQVYPAVWNGKYSFKNIFLGRDFIKHFIWFTLIIFLAWSYFNDVDVYQEFHV